MVFDVHVPWGVDAHVVNDQVRCSGVEDCEVKSDGVSRFVLRFVDPKIPIDFFRTKACFARGNRQSHCDQQNC